MRVCQKDHLERKDERLQKIVEVRKGGGGNLGCMFCVKTISV